MRWRASWAAAQITGAIVSSLLWVVLFGGWPVTGLVALLLGLTYVAGFRTRPGRWWRFGVRRPTAQLRDAVLAAIIPIAGLRGRNQPQVWLGSRLAAHQAVMATPHDLIIDRRLAGLIVTGRAPADDLCRVVSRARGLAPVLNSRLVAVADASCMPWNLVSMITAAITRAGGRVPLTSLAWRIRWIVIGVAIIDAWRHARWMAVAGLLVFAVLTWSTGHFQRRWGQRLVQLGDAQLVADRVEPVSQPRHQVPAMGTPADHADAPGRVGGEYCQWRRP